MPSTHRREAGEDDRKVIWLEFLAASAIFSIIALVLYTILTYRPA
jgi:hypothetical protein